MAIDLNNLEKVLEGVGRDKGIDRKLLIEAIEEAMLTVAKRSYGAQKDIEARYNEEISEVELFQFMNVVETIDNKYLEMTTQEALQYDSEVAIGDSIGIKLDTKHLSRIAAQTAKQVIVQKVRDAEREIIFNEFQHRKGEVIAGVVRRVDRGAVIVDLGRTEGYMPIKEQIPDEPYNSGDRIQAYLLDVQLTPKGPRIILSRSCPEYLITLFEKEVPEIREKLVEIVGASRDPGVRAKIAVKKIDPDVDPVGACVGVRGNRVQNIVQELKGERIDIVPWDEDITRFVCNALSPAEIQKVVIDEESQAIEVVVNDENLSKAIGKRGQNVRLASMLTKWRLDILSDTEMAMRIAEAKYQLGLIDGVSETMVMALYQSGYDRIQDVLDSTKEDLLQIPGFDEAKAEVALKSAAELVASGKADEKMPEELMDPDLKRKVEHRQALQEARKKMIAEANGETVSEAAVKSQSINEKLKAELSLKKDA